MPDVVPEVPVVPDVVPDAPDVVPDVVPDAVLDVVPVDVAAIALHPDSASGPQGGGAPGVVPADVFPADVAAIALHPDSASGPQGGGELGVVPLLPPIVPPGGSWLQPLGNVTIFPVFVPVRNWQATFGAVLDVSAVVFAVRGAVSALTTPIVPASITARHDAAISRGMRLQMPLAMTPPPEWMGDVVPPPPGIGYVGTPVRMESRP
ncbi:hypothetical protein [Streptomyces inhibens]|uniref:hypothetical protein n=1 Tax=Streptomyces inhibens TaxID=2293571 RepID=UPI001EE74188|nr:hypothetical protein [Streptomyces inhibens]UKY48029.1 hypothetical protein KI385_03870 [Streptomyces inhibens]